MAAGAVPAVRYSVVIPTYNRANVVTRAIESAIGQQREDLEVIVVDDASLDDTEAVVTTQYPTVLYLRQATNMGPGPARNRGVGSAQGEWVLMLDDDDALLPGAIAVLERSIGELSEPIRYPVLQFATAKGQCPAPFKVMDIADYFSGRWVGDLFMVLQRRVFLGAGLFQPEERGTAGTLWARVAYQFGIPTWDRQVVRLYHDAGERLGDPEHYLKRAADMARHHEHFLEWMNRTGLSAEYGTFFTHRALGAATYSLLAGHRRRSWRNVAVGLRRRFSVRLLMILPLAILPRRLARWLFLLYRRDG